MAAVNTAVSLQDVMAQLAALRAENAELAAKVAMTPAPGQFGLDVTKYRAPGTNGPKDKGSKGGSLAISVGNSHIYPSVAVVTAIFDHKDEILKFISANRAALSR